MKKKLFSHSNNTGYSQRWLDKCAKKVDIVECAAERCFLPISNARFWMFVCFSLFFFCMLIWCVFISRDESNLDRLRIRMKTTCVLYLTIWINCSARRKQLFDSDFNEIKGIGSFLLRIPYFMRLVLAVRNGKLLRNDNTDPFYC